MRLSISAAILTLTVVASQAADDSGCLASPTRACVLTMAVEAIAPVVAQPRPTDTDRMMLVWTTDAQVIQSAAQAGQFDLAMNFVSHFDKGYDGVDAGPLFVAMKFGQEAEPVSFIAAARDDAARNSATNAEAEALAETGNPAALPLANDHRSRASSPRPRGGRRRAEKLTKIIAPRLRSRVYSAMAPAGSSARERTSAA